MIGKLVFYMENNFINSSKIVSSYLNEVGGSSEVMHTLESGVVISNSRACFSMQELFRQLSSDYKLMKERSGEGVRLERFRGGCCVK